jgi:hypothetical protein
MATKKNHPIKAFESQDRHTVAYAAMFWDHIRGRWEVYGRRPTPDEAKELFGRPIYRFSNQPKETAWKVVKITSHVRVEEVT